MDYHGAVYGGDQYAVDMSPPFPSDRYTQSIQYKYGATPSHVGYYEDSLRYSQYGIPANLRCVDPNPYIQDDIRKSQRHTPIRTMGIPERANIIARTSCEPGLCGTEIPAAHGQKVYLAVDAVACPNCPNCANSQTINLGANMRCGACKNGGVNNAPAAVAAPNSKKENFGNLEIDNMTLFIIFIFLVLVCMFCYYWKSMGDIRESLNLIKELISKQR